VDFIRSPVYEIIDAGIRVYQPLSRLTLTEKWKIDKYQNLNGTAGRAIKLELKADGEKLVGKLITQDGEATISEGVVKGDDLSFAVIAEVHDHEIKWTYKGKISGNAIVLTMQFAGVLESNFAARRAD